MAFRFSWLLAAFAGACSITPPAGLARTRRQVRIPSDRCRVTAEGPLVCSFADAPERPVALPFPVHSTAPRAAGGVYVLGSKGELVRLDPRGNVTGGFETRLSSLATGQDYVCGLDVDGDL